MSIFPFSINLSEHRRTPKIQQDMIKIYIYMQDMNKNSYINTLSNHSTSFLRNSPDESLPKGVERFVGSSGLISPLKRGLRVHLWFASPFSGTVRWPCRHHRCRYEKNDKLTGVTVFFPVIFLMCVLVKCAPASQLRTIWHHPTYPTIPQIEKSNDEPNEKKLNLFHQLLLKCVYHSIHPWLRNTSRKNPSPCPLLPTCWAPAFCCSKTKVHNLSYLMQPGMTMGWIVQHFPRESQGVTR